MGCNAAKQVSAPSAKGHSPSKCTSEGDTEDPLQDDALMDLGGVSDPEDDDEEPASPISHDHGLGRAAAAHAAGQAACESNSGSEMGSDIASGMGSNYGSTSLPLEKITRPRKKKLSRQASGHEGFNFIKQYNGIDDFKKGVPAFILKSLDKEESIVYKELQTSDDSLLRVTARSFGEVRDKEGNEFLKLDNLLRVFARGPHVMDCKIGVRSFTEDEVYSKKLRDDMYTRMMALDPSYPTAEEHEKKAVTKYRWMDFNDQYTTLRNLGFRIDGIANSSTAGKVSKKDLHKARSMQDIALCIIDNFMPRFARGCGDSDKEQELQSKVAFSVRSQLKELISVLEESEFVQTHSIVGASLLFAVDAHGPTARVFMIDFAKSKTLPDGITIDHRKDWVPGNHEDGIIRGVENLLRCWELVDDILAAKMPEIALVV
eukprot:gb/GFBE01046274.1/.p1 GENE.gb/GFBE01046274.1/~~gb/GFBE01046274.1/.p1  ORF type:complete len:431 (+),score=107.31 gb/GFBE01046274.1/:1-1293(+)